jgi:hypothetical protein
MHDPFQNYATMGVPYNLQQNPGINSLAGMNPLAGINPLAADNPLAGIHPLAAAAFGLSQGIPTAINPQNGQQGYGSYPGQNFITPQQLQLAALASQAVIPQLLQNQIVAALLANPLVAAGLHSQFGQQPQQFGQQPQQFGQQPQQFGQQPQQFGQQAHSLYPQFGQIGGSPYGQGLPAAGNSYPLAPQSWVGQGGQLGGQGYGQIHPLVAQLAARALQGQGSSPWGY